MVRCPCTRLLSSQEEPPGAALSAGPAGPGPRCAVCSGQPPPARGLAARGPGSCVAVWPRRLWAVEVCRDRAAGRPEARGRPVCTDFVCQHYVPQECPPTHARLRDWALTLPRRPHTGGGHSASHTGLQPDLDPQCLSSVVRGPASPLSAPLPQDAAAPQSPSQQHCRERLAALSSVHTN